MWHEEDPVLGIRLRGSENRTEKLDNYVTNNITLHRHNVSMCHSNLMAWTNVPSFLSNLAYTASIFKCY
jgi:hypothetical protein